MVQVYVNLHPGFNLQDGTAGFRTVLQVLDRYFLQQQLWIGQGGTGGLYRGRGRGCGGSGRRLGQFGHEIVEAQVDELVGEGQLAGDPAALEVGKVGVEEVLEYGVHG